MSDATTYPNTQGSSLSEWAASQPGMIGPANWVDPVTYRKIRAKLRKGYVKKRKTTTKKRSGYTRRYYRSGGALSGMGPIVITGRGGYWTDKFKTGASAAYRALQRGLPSGTFNRLGTAAGGAMFGAPGAALGGMLGSGISSVAGFGAYTVRKNDLLSVDEGMQVPTFGDLNHGVIISHREYIGDITQSQNFTINQYPINPGSSKTFPWLSAIAANFDQYEILGMLFHYRSTASDFGTTTNMAMGTIIMATDYDAADASYSSKMEMENAQYSTSGKPSQDLLHAIECDPSITFSPLKYVRTGPVPSGKDPRLYDQGNFQFATTGMPASSGSVGELWVTYKIAFFKPSLNAGVSVLTDYFLTAGSSATDYWGITPIANANNSLGVTLSALTLTFPATVVVGTYYFVQMWTEGNSTAVSPPSTAVSGCTLIKNSATLGTATRYWHTWIVKITAPSATMTMPGTGTLPSSPVLGYVLITQLDSEVGPLIV